MKMILLFGYRQYSNEADVVCNHQLHLIVDDDSDPAFLSCYMETENDAYSIGKSRIFVLQGLFTC